MGIRSRVDFSCSMSMSHKMILGVLMIVVLPSSSSLVVVPGPSQPPASATTFPHGSTAKEWPGQKVMKHKKRIGFRKKVSAGLIKTKKLQHNRILSVSHIPFLRMLKYERTIAFSFFIMLPVLGCCQYVTLVFNRS